MQGFLNCFLFLSHGPSCPQNNIDKFSLPFLHVESINLVFRTLFNSCLKNGATYVVNRKMKCLNGWLRCCFPFIFSIWRFKWLLFINTISQSVLVSNSIMEVKVYLCFFRQMFRYMIFDIPIAGPIDPNSSSHSHGICCGRRTIWKDM